MFSNYTFKHNDVWGFSNEAVVIRQYRGGDFQLQ
jgi:hypothetical protein